MQRLGNKKDDTFHLNDDIDDEKNTDDKKKKLPIGKMTFVGIIVMIILIGYISGDLKIAMNMLKDYKSPMDSLHAGADKVVSDFNDKQINQQQQQYQLQIQQQQKVTIKPTESLLEKQKVKANEIIESVRLLKKLGVVMETDKKAIAKIAMLQKEVKKLLYLEYGNGPFTVLMELEFPSTMSDYNEKGKKGEITIQLAPVEVVPYSVYYFLEMVKVFEGGAFHRVAGHVLQAMISGNGEGLAFQEYSPLFPHKKLTLGYAGRPGGPEFYISTIDNVLNHGPGSQGSKTEADSCFGTVIGGFDTVERIKLQPGKMKPNGFIDKRENFIKIVKITLLH